MEQLRTLSTASESSANSSLFLRMLTFRASLTMEQLRTLSTASESSTSSSLCHTDL
jgi:hypothetical protein